MKFAKKFMALALAGALLFTTSVTAKADWVDGDTGYENRVTDSYGTIYTPTVMTNFHAPSILALIPFSPAVEINQATKANVSYYDDARSVVYVGENNEYGELAQAAVNSALTATGATKAATVSLNLFLYEGKAYKQVVLTDNEVAFKIQIPKALRSASRDFCVLRLNVDGTVSYLTDLDTDNATVTFKTNYFGAYDLYVLAYAADGAFDAYAKVDNSTANAAAATK